MQQELDTLRAERSKELRETAERGVLQHDKYSHHHARLLD
jgi:hypothetical protein